MFLSNMRTASHSRWNLLHDLLGDDEGLPPGPRELPIVGSLGLVRDPLSALTRTHRELGDAVCFRVGPFRFISVADPELAQHVLVRNHRNYVKSRNYEGLRLVLGNGLVTSEGEHWRRQRKLAQPAFHRQRLAALAEVMAACVEERLQAWDERTLRGPATVDVHQEMMQLTLRIVGRTLFGTDLGTDLGELGPAITTALHKANDFAESLLRLPLWLPTPSNLRFGRAKRVLDGIVHHIIEERRRSAQAGDAQRDDVLGMLMAATDESGTERMSDEDLRDEVMTLFLAGHETIATAMSWTWMLLHQHPDVAARVRDEAATVLGGRAPGLHDLPRLTYTSQVLDEAMRLYPPAWIMERAALEEDRLGPWRVPPRAIVAVSPWVLHRHPALWPEPSRFDPDRFAPERAEGRHKHAYLPFGAGPRICIGNAFALMEAKIILATMIQRYAVEVTRPDRVVPDPKVTLRPKDGMPGRLRRVPGPTRPARAA